MIEIKLTQGKVAVIDDADWDLVRGFKWCAHNSRNSYYAVTRARREGGGQRIIFMHRLILGITAQNVQVDHRDGNSLNNQRENLRSCSHAENQWNRGAQSNNKSGYKGIYWREDCMKWQSQIRHNGKMNYLGMFQSPEAAYAAYCAAAAKLHGEFANYGIEPQPISP